MKVIDVYEQYFKGHLVYNGAERRAVVVKLIATSDEGKIRYEAALTFFPFRDPEDFAVSYDAYSRRAAAPKSGRRS